MGRDRPAGTAGGAGKRRLVVVVVVVGVKGERPLTGRRICGLYGCIEPELEADELVNADLAVGPDDNDDDEEADEDAADRLRD